MGDMTHEQVIQALGGYRRLAGLFRLDVTATFKWRARGIPARHWRRIVDLARSENVAGITYETLAARYAPTTGASAPASKAA